MESSELLRAEDVGWKVQDQQVLMGVSLSLRADDLFVIMGVNGSGKTSLLKILGGLIEPSRGSVQVLTKTGDFRDMHSALEQRQVDSAFVFERGGVINNLDIYDNLALPLRYHGQCPEAQIEQLVEGALSRFDLNASAHLRPSELSPGLLRRVQIARAKIMKPRIVFYDNPGAGLDTHQGQMVKKCILELHEEGKGLSVVTTGEAGWEWEAADRVAFLNEGRLEGVGTAKELLEDPSTALQEFLGQIKNG